MENNKEEEDVLSLCDLPDEKDDYTPPVKTDHQEDSDFIFCSLTEEPEMCAADEVFYQGRILPYCDINSRSVSSSEDRSSSVGRLSSSSSGSGGAAAGEQTGTRISAANKQRTGRLNSRKKSSAWDIFRPGLIVSQPAEVDFQDLKNRYQRNSRNWGEKKKKEEEEEEKKKKRRSYGCKCCSSDAVDSKVVVIKRSAAVRDGQVVVAVVVDDEENLLPETRLDDNPTFQWLNKHSRQGQSG